MTKRARILLAETTLNIMVRNCFVFWMRAYSGPIGHELLFGFACIERSRKARLVPVRMRAQGPALLQTWRIRHERSPLAKPQSANQLSTMPTAKARACTILVGFERAQTELVGKAVILTNGMAGTVDRLWLDELHGLRIFIGSHEGNWPVATIKFAEK